MKYNEIVHFEPIETVVQLESSKSQSNAIQLIKTFVISKGISNQLNKIVIPTLQYDQTLDNKGIIVVGKYGTGKSHLMSVIAGIAEFPEAIEYLNDKKVASNAGKIAGKFKVLRIEIGSTKMSLRDIILGEIEKYLVSIDIEYKFKDANTVNNNKDLIVEMMDVFNKKYPEYGLLIVVDELLDFLRSRNEQEIVSDLIFLREIGEVCKSTKFRFIAGVQEMLWDNPRFNFVADSMGRVKDRFEQMTIKREDISFVVQERLLKKSDTQKVFVRKHLEKFTHIYKNMGERLEEYVNLFPVHPMYIEVFENISIAERREVLKTLSISINAIINTDVPERNPGLITYDEYWPYIENNASNLANPEVKEVMDKSKTLRSIIQQSYPEKYKSFKPVAIRIIDALSVHRLTTARDIYAKLGLTSDQLRDDLCLYVDVIDGMDKDESSEFLKTSIETILKQIMKTVSGQFISFNEDNGQYYLDLKKSVDYDAKVHQKAEILSPGQLDRYYFNLLKQLMERDDNTVVTGYKIWLYEIEWLSHKITRQGYLFFGAPNQRSTAQPPRDFYIYFLPYFDQIRFTDGKRADEVFFKLSRIDEKFIENIKLYAASIEMAQESIPGIKEIYMAKSEELFPKLTKWIKDNFNIAYDVIYKGVTKKPTEINKGGLRPKDTFKETIDRISAEQIDSWFNEISPEYPKFRKLITKESIDKYASDAIKYIATDVRTDNGATILEGLELLEDISINVQKSRYLRAIIDKLDQKGFGMVLNRDEILVTEGEFTYMDKYRLEPEWIAVLIVAGIWNGNFEVKIQNKMYDVRNLDEIASMPVINLTEFKYIKKPSDMPVAELNTLFEIMSLPKGFLVQSSNQDEAVKQMVSKALTMLQEIAPLSERLNTGLSYGSRKILNESDIQGYKKNYENVKLLLEYVKTLKTPAHLKHFKYKSDELIGLKSSMKSITEFRQLSDLVSEIGPDLAYLQQSSLILPQDHPWVIKYIETENGLISSFSDREKRLKSDFRKNLLGQIRSFKEEYKSAYAELHKKARLDYEEEQKLIKLKNDSRLKRLSALRKIESVVSSAKFDEIVNRLSQLKPCKAFTTEFLDSSPICVNCKFTPRDEVSSRSVEIEIKNIDRDLDQAETAWTNMLIDNILDPSVQESIKLLRPDQRKSIQELIILKKLPETIDDELIISLQEAFSGINKLVIKQNELINAMSDYGIPCTIDEFKNRFDEYLKTKTKGFEKNKVRIIIELS